MKLITAQKELLEIINEVDLGISNEDKFWIALRDSADEDHLEYGDVVVTKTSEGIQLKCDNFEIVKSGKHTLIVSPPARKCTLPKQSLDIRLVLAVALSKSSENLLVGTERGSLIRFDTKNKAEIKQIESAHFSDITMLRIFPSDKVIASIGLDFQIKLWDLELGNEQPTRVFKHQKKRITDVALIGAGRNFVLTSEDGSTVLWECASGNVVSEFLRIDDHEDPALCVTILSTEKKLACSDIVNGELQFECEDKVLYVGYRSGVIQEFRIASHSQTSVTLKRDKDAAVTSLIANEHDLLVAGYEDGTVVMWDKHAEQPKHEVQFHPSFPISNMTFAGSETLVFDNGPEGLFTMNLTTRDVGQLIGLLEAFRVHLIAAVENTVVVATEDEIVQY